MRAGSRTAEMCTLEIEPTGPEPRTLLVARTFAAAVTRYFDSPEPAVASLKSAVTDACTDALASNGSGVRLRIVVRRWGGTCSVDLRVLRS